MLVPRDLSKRILEAAEQTPVVDVHERLIPESKRVSARHDLITWLLAYAGEAIRALEPDKEEMALLNNVQGDPDQRWAVVARLWPFVRTTAAGRVVLRVAWELFGAEEINDRTWMDVSVRLWKSSERGFYQELLCKRANVRMTLVDGPVEAEMRPCCAAIKNYDPLLTPGCRAEIEALLSSVGQGEVTTSHLDESLAHRVRLDAEQGVVALKMTAAPELSMSHARREVVYIPSMEEVGWALGRTMRCEEAGAPVEAALHAFLCYSFLDHAAQSGRPVLVPVGGPRSVEWLAGVVPQYPGVRFVALLGSGGDAARGAEAWAAAPALASLACILPNVALALGDIWQAGPYTALEALRAWLQCVPLQRMFAVGGNTTMVEAVCAQALIVRERLASLLSEMVADGSLDEEDARLALERLLNQNAVEYLGLQGLLPAS